MDLERKAIGRIASVHAAHLAAAEAMAKMLAAEAALATEDGIRDLVDEDAEADAAVAAALVRQLSDRAMAAHMRYNDLVAMGSAIAFGHTTDDDGETTYVGRISVIDGDDPLVVDWRAKKSVPFYRATPLARMRVSKRRHLIYDNNVLTDYSDEALDAGILEAATGLRGEAAIMASVTAPTSDKLKSVVATIQAEQDAVIRAPSNRPLVVQGGPGTGKTVVALHRAAYLLYDQRVALADSGVLIVGPSSAFLSHISAVLPALGESGVISSVPEKLYSGVLLAPGPSNPLKSELTMAEVLSRAISDRRRPPKEPLVVYHGSVRVRLPVKRLVQLFKRAKTHRKYNDGADAFHELIVAELLSEIFDPNFPHDRDAREGFIDSAEVQEFIAGHWPALTPEEALNDLLGSVALMAAASTGADLASLHEERWSYADLGERRWHTDDIPLLDELYSLLGTSHGIERAETILEVAEGVISELFMTGADTDFGDTSTVAQLSARERSWIYGHVIVDEAQDLTPMEWRMIVRRSSDGGITIVGDQAQRSGGLPGRWEDALPPELADHELRELTINYRSPEEVNTVASRILSALAPGLTAPAPIRTSGFPVEFIRVESMADELEAIVASVRPEQGRMGVIGADQALTPVGAKGLEFDVVVVVEPAAITEGPFGLGQLYVAVTRTTRRLIVVHSRALPTSLA